jgi:outer membrane receptor for ferrienterochelin and colicins
VAGVINMVRREPHENHFSVDFGLGSYRWRPEVTGGANGQFANIGRGWAADFYYRGYHRSHVDMDRDGFTELTRRASNGGGGTLFRRFFDGAARLTLGGSGLSDFRRGGDQLDLKPEYTNITEQVRSERAAAFARWNHSVSPTFYYNVSSSFSRLARHSYYGAGMDPDAYGETRNPLATNDASAGWQRGRHTFTVGGQYWWERISDVYAGYGRDTRQTFRNGGVYVQDEWRMSPRVVLLGGSRFDKSNLLDHWVASPRGNVRLGLTHALNLRVGFSTGFRPPQVFDEDLHIAAVNGEAMYVRLASGLKEESSRSFTSALDYAGRLRGGVFQAGASFFWTRLDDVFQLKEISSDASGNRVMERTNGPGSRFRGVEFSSSWKVSAKLALRGGATLQQSRYDVPEPNFGSLRYFRSPNAYGFAGVDLNLPHKIEWLHTFDFTGKMLVPHYAGYIPQDRLETSPRFAVWNTIVARTWQVGADEHHKLRAYFKLINGGNCFQKDFDRGPQRDSVYMYGPLTPRSAVVGATVIF